MESGSRRIRTRSLEGYLFILPWLVGLLAFQLGPILYTLGTSFTLYNIAQAPIFIGADNYAKLASDELFTTSLSNTSTYVLVTVPARLAFALLIAVILSGQARGMGIYRTLYYLPSIIGPSVAIAIVWKALFSDQGVLNSLLGTLGIVGPSWLGDPGLSLYTVASLAVWQFGSSMVIFLAGLRQIPTELYESARVDGAPRVSVFFKVTIPMLTPMIFFTFIMQVIHTFQVFAAPFIIYGGNFGPLNSCLMIVMYIYRTGFQQFRMGYASAVAWILFVIIGVFTAIVFRTEKKWVFYNN